MLNHLVAPALELQRMVAAHAPGAGAGAAGAGAAAGGGAAAGAAAAVGGTPSQAPARGGARRPRPRGGADALPVGPRRTPRIHPPLRSRAAAARAIHRSGSPADQLLAPHIDLRTNTLRVKNALDEYAALDDERLLPSQGCIKVLVAPAPAPALRGAAPAPFALRRRPRARRRPRRRPRTSEPLVPEGLVRARAAGWTPSCSRGRGALARGRVWHTVHLPPLGTGCFESAPAGAGAGLARAALARRWLVRDFAIPFGPGRKIAEDVLARAVLALRVPSAQPWRPFIWDAQLSSAQRRPPGGDALGARTATRSSWGSKSASPG